MHMEDNNPDWAEHLRTVGESDTVNTKSDTTPKLHDSDVQCTFVGFAENHKRGVY
jgi:hypothetical protein